MKNLNVTEEDWQQMIEEYSRGIGLMKIGRPRHVSVARIEREFRQRGILLRDVHNRYLPLTQEEIQDVVARYKRHETQVQIASVYNVGITTVKRAVKAGGVPLRDAYWQGDHTKHPRWKGGLPYKGCNGYLEVFIPPDHWLKPYENHKGRMLQHRFVMAESLGRPLTRTESVHHINGDRTDNRLENLQLRQSKHGPGAAMVCACCGSHNIVYVPIADNSGG
jgi:hypothetical protein